MTYTTKEIKNMSFDIFRIDGKYMDWKHLNFNELDRFFGECEYMFDRQWEPIFVKQWKADDTCLCHLVNCFYKHGYIVCFTGEMHRDLHRQLHGHSTLLDYAQQSDYKQKCEKNRLKYIKKKQEDKNK